MIRKWIRNWLFDQAPAEPGHSREAPYPINDPDIMFFSVKPVENGYIVTYRSYDQTKPRVTANYGEIGYTDKVLIVPESASIIEAINRLLVEEKLKLGRR